MLMTGPFQGKEILSSPTPQVPSLTHQASTTSRNSGRGKP
jgi:hypothetical protein